MSGNRSRQLGISAIRGLGLEGSGKLAPGALNPDTIQAVREHSQNGFGAYDLNYTLENPTENPDGFSTWGQYICRGYTDSIVNSGVRNLDKETRVLASMLYITFPVVAYAALVASNTRLTARLVMGVGNSTTQDVYLDFVEFPLIANQNTYTFCLGGGGSFLFTNAASGAQQAIRLTGTWDGWVPATAHLKWEISSPTSEFVFPTNTFFGSKAVLVQQEMFNAVPR